VRPYLVKPFTKRAGGVAQGVGPEFKPQYDQKRNLKPSRHDYFILLGNFPEKK
jgi:hypothetical protein